MRRAMSALVFCLAIIMVLSGCEVVSVNRERDMQQVVAEIGDTKILKKEIYEEAKPTLAQESIDIYDETLSADLRTQIDEYLLQLLEAKVDEIVLDEMAKKMEIALTEDEIKETEESSREYFDLMKMYYLGYDKENPEDYEGEDLEAEFEELLQTMGYGSEEDYTKAQQQQQISSKLQEEATKDITSTDEEVKERYETDLQAQKDVFATPDESAEATPTPSASEAASPEDEAAADEDPDTQYQTLAVGGSNGAGNYVLYKPSGYKVVKHILLELKEEDKKKIEDIDTKISELENEIYPIETEISEAEAAKEDAEDKLAQLKGEAEPDETASQTEEPSASPSESLDVESMSEEEKAQAIEEQQKIADEKTEEIKTLNEKLTPFQTQLNDAQEEREQASQKGAENLQPTVDEITKKYEDGADFNDLIDEYNADPGMKEGSGKAYGYLITPDGAGFNEEFAAAAMALSTVGELSEPTLSANGVHIIRLEMDANEADLPFETVQSVVKEKVESEKKSELWTELLETTWPKELNVKIYEDRLNFAK